jgi:murein DD-endopeptidase MepM/ murein hydrolase activator NlpD
MKTLLRFQLTLVLLLNVNFLLAQNFDAPRGGEVLIPRNTEPCLNELQREAIKARISFNIKQLSAEGKLQPINREGGHPLFSWPVSQAGGFNYNSVWSVSNYIDHDPAYPDQISDYECGTRSYDTTSGYNHQGFDIITWPFWWKQMDRDQGINIAAAEGQILDKNDGAFDRNCGFNSSTPNYIALQHDDGSETWYLHMKEGSLTTKNIGDMVTQGEFLGVIGSSGSSTVPHLHFEVYDSADQLIDPSMGPCNNFNSDSWWISQKPYYTPAINAVLTHTTWPDFATCPITETTNESNQFDLGDEVYYGIYLKDQRAGTSVHLKITRPDNSVQYEWDYALVDDQQISYWMWFYPNDMEGMWTWEATYMGDVATHTFNVGALGTQENELANTTAYPNPMKDKLFIESEIAITQITLKEMHGRTVMTENSPVASINELNVAPISKGIYFAILKGDNQQTKTIKLIKD